MRNDYLRFDFINSFLMYGFETKNLVVRLDSIIDCYVKFYYDFNDDKFCDLVLRVNKSGSSGCLLFPKKDDLSGYWFDKVTPQNIENTEEIIIASICCENEDYSENRKEYKRYYDIIRKKQYEYFELELDV